MIDTSVYLTDAEAVFKLANNDIFVPLKVLEEIEVIIYVPSPPAPDVASKIIVFPTALP